MSWDLNQNLHPKYFIRKICFFDLFQKVQVTVLTTTTVSGNVWLLQRKQIPKLEVIQSLSGPGNQPQCLHWRKEESNGLREIKDCGIFIQHRHKISEDWTSFQVLSISFFKSVFMIISFPCAPYLQKTVPEFWSRNDILWQLFHQRTCRKKINTNKLSQGCIFICMNK